MTDVLATHAEAFGDRPAVIADDPHPGQGPSRSTVTTFGELDQLVNRCAWALRSAGAEPGNRMAWCGPNSLEVLVTIHAARKAGLVAVPVSYRFTADEMAYVITNSGATHAVIDAEQAPLLASVVDEIPTLRDVMVFGGPVPAATGFRCWDEALAAAPATELEDRPDGDPDADPAVVSTGASMIYTSGTTGRPKGALRTTIAASTVITAVAMIGELGYRFGDEMHLTTGPLYHSGPLSFASLNHMLGCPIVVTRRFDPVAWLRLVREHRVTNTFSAPTQLKRIVSLPDDELRNADLSSMRCLIANAAPVPYALKKEVIEKLGDGFLFEIYGSTELGVCTILRPEDQLRKPGSCGKPYGGIELRIVGDDGTETAPGEPGELYIRTTMAMDRYHESDEQLSELAEGAWKSVGDVAFLDEEGYLSISDRKRDMIISGGMNIYPAEVEAALHEHPAVFDVAVIGVPDDEWGESVHAILQARPGMDLDVDELRAFVSGKVSRFKEPRTYEVRAELPRTESGKLSKRTLRDEFWVGHDRAI